MTELHSRSTPWATPAQERAYNDMTKMRKFREYMTTQLNLMSLELANVERTLESDDCITALHPVYDGIQGLYDDLSDALSVAESNHRLAE